MARTVLTEQQLLEADVLLEQGRSLGDVADHLGVAYNTLWRRMRRRQSRVTRIVFHARCRCGAVIQASQDSELGSGFERWDALARQHARQVHRVRPGLLQGWTHSLWTRGGARKVLSISGTEPPASVQAAN